MIQKTFENISLDDMQNLVSNKVPESRTLEYKQALPGNKDEDKKEFLADVSSFANTSGGDLLYGVNNKDWELTPLNGNGDQEILRLENIIQNGLEPRIKVHIKPIPVGEGYLLLIRIPQSFLAPHMVVFSNTSRFFGRNSAGKYQMDVGEIRSAFAASETLPEKVRQFRANSLALVNADETPVPLTQGPKAVLHIVPLSAFHYPPREFDFSQTKPVNGPEGSGSQYHRFNFDGYLGCSFQGDDGKHLSYTQYFRSGIVEFASSMGIWAVPNSHSFSKAYEKNCP